MTNAHNDSTFFTNQDATLLDRFNKILRANTQFFDVLVGYFRTSGFHQLYQAMDKVEKIRILVGINVDSATLSYLQKTDFILSSKEAVEQYKNTVVEEMDGSEDSDLVEKGVQTFIHWISSGKLELRIYPHAMLHAKLYIMQKNLELSPDYVGSVITGSSNFSKSGLIDNLEFNVELKDSRDIDFALLKFNELWEQSIDISAEYVDTIRTRTWLSEDVTPYEIYLKSIYEYFNEEINDDKIQTGPSMLPEGFIQYQYQMDAVNRAKKILEAYNGVFISDVVGLGKTFTCALLAQKLKGKKLVICPPVLVEYWENALEDFDVSARVESLGKLDHIIDRGIEEYKYVFIDEAHRFRNQNTESFLKLHQICFNKKVILISATPQNNNAQDIANQIYLFQPKKNSTIIPNHPNIEAFFNNLGQRLRSVDKNSEDYAELLRSNSQEIRDKVLRNIMVRRTRKEISRYYKKDLDRQGLSFPNLSTPKRIVYEFDEATEYVFDKTIHMIKTLNYARYLPLTYLQKTDEEPSGGLLTAQRNMHGFMKSILLKRLESSFFAFKKTLERFILSYEKFIKMCDTGKVYISKKIDIYDLLDNGDDERLLNYIDEQAVDQYRIESFSERFIPDLHQDLDMLKQLSHEWTTVDADPKLKGLIDTLQKTNMLRNNKIIIFTESKETAEYLQINLEWNFQGRTTVFTGQSKQASREIIEANFNPNYRGEKKNNLSILITTDVLAEGINLHRSNTIINYDLPWNPTKLMQRVGRINRVGTEHDELFVYNIFPTALANQHLSLEENIIAKIQSFHDTLGEDSKYLTEEEVVDSHQLFGKKLYDILNSKQDYEETEQDEEESELKYLTVIREIRDHNPSLFTRVKKLPKKSRSSISKDEKEASVISFIRQGALKKFICSSEWQISEVPFLAAMRMLEATPETQKTSLDKEFFKRLDSNKIYFNNLVSNLWSYESAVSKNKNELQVLKIVKALQKLSGITEQEEQQLQTLKMILEKGIIPNKITKNLIKGLSKIKEPFLMFQHIFESIPEEYLNYQEVKRDVREEEIETILSLYMN